MPLGKSGRDSATAQRLIDAAAREFACHGYVATRIRDVVEAAGANLAAVNYHFGGKEGLYQATLAHLAREARDASTIDSPEFCAMPPEDQFRAYVRVMLMRYVGQERVFPLGSIVAHELLDPTPASGQIVLGVSKPQFDRLAEILRALLGVRARAGTTWRSPASPPPRKRRSSSSGGGSSRRSFRRSRPTRLWSTGLPATSRRHALPRCARPARGCGASAGPG